jgi:hypothetical protein
VPQFFVLAHLCLAYLGNLLSPQDNSAIFL